MVSGQIEKIKQEYTDKYVVADADRPELARFRDHVGQVKTVNMSGRALVEFIDYHLNIGWFDIDLDYLKVVDKPAPKEKAPAAKKPAPAAKKQAPAAKKQAPERSKMSVAEMLAAARAEKSAGAPPPVEEAPSTQPEPAAAEPAAESSAGGVTKVDRSSMSVADMIAYCREKDSQ